MKELILIRKLKQHKFILKNIFKKGLVMAFLFGMLISTYMIMVGGLESVEQEDNKGRDK